MSTVSPRPAISQKTLVSIALALVAAKCILFIWLGSRTEHVPEADEQLS